MNADSQGRHPTRRGLLGAGAASLGILAIPLPAAADAFSGTNPPAPAGTNYTLTGGTPFAAFGSYVGGTGVGVAWSTTTNGTWNYSDYYAGTRHTFNYTIYRNGQLFAYGTCIGDHGFISGGTFLSGTQPKPADPGKGFYPYTGNFASPPFSIYVVNVAGVRWRLVDYTGGTQNWVTY